MKKFILCATTLAVVAGTIVFSRPSQGQAPAAGNGGLQNPHQVALIDMGFVFNEYEKFKAMSTSLREEAKGVREKEEAVIQQAKQLQEQLTSGTYSQDSPEYAKIESQLLGMQTKLEADRKVLQRDFLRKEAEIYKTVYLEVQDAVQKYATYYKYTVVLRFNRSPIEDAANPQEIIQSMNRPVVYYAGEDDLTKPILDYHNGQYQKAAAGPAAAAPAAGTTR